MLSLCLETLNTIVSEVFELSSGLEKENNRNTKRYFNFLKKLE
jgi:hypothetical protein